jgi:hypothetical protein
MSAWLRIGVGADWPIASSHAQFAHRIRNIDGRDLLGWTPQSLGLVSARQSLPSTYAEWSYLFSIASDKNRDYIATVPERDENTEAVRNAEKATESEPVQGEDLLKSDKLKRKLSEAKEAQKRIESESEESEESAE